MGVSWCFRYRCDCQRWITHYSLHDTGILQTLVMQKTANVKDRNSDIVLVLVISVESCSDVPPTPVKHTFSRIYYWHVLNHG
jgi:hypothetical protein